MKNVLRILGIALIAITLSFTNNNSKTVYIDVGHGGRDTGAVVNETKEKEVLLAIAQKIERLSQDTNVKVILSRNSDEYISLSDRSNEINKSNADCVISLHINNAKDTNKKGKEIFIYEKTAQLDASKQLAHRLIEAFDEKIEVKNENYHILRNVKLPIVLIELGYLSNEEDRKKLNTDEEQTKIAETILKAVR